MFANEALLLIGHGSLRYPDAGRTDAPTCAKPSGPRTRSAQVAMGLLNGAPSVPAALARLRPHRFGSCRSSWKTDISISIAVPRALVLRQQADAGGAPAALPRSKNALADGSRGQRPPPEGTAAYPRLSAGGRP